MRRNRSEENSLDQNINKIKTTVLYGTVEDEGRA